MGNPKPPIKGPIDGIKREIAKLGYGASQPWFVVWGKQPEPVRKYEKILTIREDLLRLPPAKLLVYLEGVMNASSTVGYDWKGSEEKRGSGHSSVPRRNLKKVDREYRPFRAAPVKLLGLTAPPDKRCRNCGRSGGSGLKGDGSTSDGSKADGATFHKNKANRDKLQSYCVDCQWWASKAGHDRAKARSEAKRREENYEG